MSDFIHAREYLQKGDIVVLNCDTQCNLKLLTDSNFQRYRNGERHEVYGHFYEAFPAKLEIPHDDHWNVVIDLGGGRANIRYDLSYIKRS